MTAQEITALKLHMADLSAYYRLQISDTVLNMYAQDLSDLDFETVMSSFEKYRKNHKNRFMPLPSMIRDLITPEVDEETIAISTASKVVQAVSKHGWSNASDARAFVGELGWAGIQRFGGWMAVCENLGQSINLGTFQAQLREILKSEIKVQKAGGYAALEYHKDPVQSLSDRKNEQIGALVKHLKEIK